MKPANVNCPSLARHAGSQFRDGDSIYTMVFGIVSLAKLGQQTGKLVDVDATTPLSVAGV